MYPAALKSSDEHSRATGSEVAETVIVDESEIVSIVTLDLEMYSQSDPWILVV
jgi:hypothetical protein